MAHGSSKGVAGQKDSMGLRVRAARNKTGNVRLTLLAIFGTVIEQGVLNAAFHVQPYG
jgi:hypothetical protein